MDTQKNNIYRVRLTIFQSEKENFAIRQQFENFCKDQNITIYKKTRMTKSRYTYLVCINNNKELQKLKNFHGMYQLEIATPLSTPWL